MIVRFHRLDGSLLETWLCTSAGRNVRIVVICVDGYPPLLPCWKVHRVDYRRYMYTLLGREKLMSVAAVSIVRPPSYCWVEPYGTSGDVQASTHSTVHVQPVLLSLYRYLTANRLPFYQQAGRTTRRTDKAAVSADPR